MQVAKEIPLHFPNMRLLRAKTIDFMLYIGVPTDSDKK